MTTNIKEFFNKLSRDNNFKRINLDSQNKLKRERYNKSIDDKTIKKIKIMPYPCNYDIPDFTEQSHFINCNNNFLDCPILWKILIIDFKDKNKRYCEVNHDYVYKVDNITIFIKYQNKNIAISDSFLKNNKDKLEKDTYNKLKKNIEISKLFLIYKRYLPDFISELKLLNLSLNKQIEKIVLNILDDKILVNKISKIKSDNKELYIINNINHLIKSGIDIEFIFNIVINTSSSEDIKNHILKKLNNNVNTN